MLAGYQDGKLFTDLYFTRYYALLCVNLEYTALI